MHKFLFYNKIYYMPLHVSSTMSSLNLCKGRPPTGAVYYNNKEFCVLHNTVEHNYISSSSTLGLQLHVSALYVGHLQVVT